MDKSKKSLRSNESFNPVKEDKDGVRAKRVIWTTKSLNLALKGLEEGRKLVANPFYENNTKILKADLVFDRTEEEIQEWLKCKNDVIYFVEKYCKIMTPEGIQQVKLRDYQIEYLQHLEKNRLSILLSARQAGKTVTSALFMLHYICFNVDKNALVVANKLKTAAEVLDKAKKIYLELPYFLKPGIQKWNEGAIVLDNGCRLMCEATTINSGISFTFHCVLWDEAAHVAPNIMDKFYNNLFPTITAGKARFMITSTQNGYNLFYRLYKAAEAGISEYKAFKVDWDRIPEWNPEKKCWEKRDEEWHQKQVANYGSEEAFNKQFGTNFDVSANTLISMKSLQKNQKHLLEFENKEMPGVPHSEAWFWHPNIDPIMSRQCHLILTTDIAEGGGGDSTVCMVHRMIDPGKNNVECIGYFKSNTISREDAVLSIQSYICKLCDQEKSLLSYERNVYGDMFLKQLQENAEKNKNGCGNFDLSVVVKYYNDSFSNFVCGIKITSGNKSKHCLLYKEAYERDMLINESAQFMIELSNFTDKGNGTYAAAFGHDDMVMAEIQLTFVRETLQYKLLKDDFEERFNVELPDNIYNPYELNFDPYNIEAYSNNRLYEEYEKNEMFNRLNNISNDVKFL